MMVDIEKIRTIRVEDPAAIQRAATARSRRPLPGRMMLIAADHPARGSLAARGRPQAMADREELLARVVTALERPGVDGVLGTPDLVEDLLLLGALDDKVVIGSMNRGGLAGSAFELDDRFTVSTAGRCWFASHSKTRPPFAPWSTRPARCPPSPPKG
jgi:hypothetical protein